MAAYQVKVKYGVKLMQEIIKNCFPLAHLPASNIRVWYRDDDGDMINLSEDPSGFAFGEMLGSAKEVKDRSTKRFFFRQVKSIHHYREKVDELSWKRRFLRLLSTTSRLVYNRSNYLSHQHRLRIPPQRQLQNMLKKVL